MSYIENHLMGGEEIRERAHLHWIVYARGAVLLGLGVLCLGVGRAGGPDNSGILVIGIFLIFFAAIALFIAFLKRCSWEFAVTNKRVITKVGLIRRSSTEILLRQVEGITVRQGLLGRLFNYGSIKVEGTGRDETPYPNIAFPMGFRLAVQEQIERITAPVNVAPPQPTPPVIDDNYTKLLKLNELREKGILTDEEFKAEKAKILG